MTYICKVNQNATEMRLKFIVMLLALILVRPSADAQGDFEVKGIHLDMRAQVMTMDAVKEVVRKAAGEGINTLMMEYEATFPFEKHATLCNRYAYTKQEVKDLVDYCSSLGVDVIPLQNCFGHCEYILRHQRYARLRENSKEISQVCPTRTKEAERVFREIFAEIAALHPSRYIHIGADETRLLGHCRRCADKVSKEGVSRLFVDYVALMCRIVSDLGKTPIIWADMILQHPEALNDLPKDLVILDWNYGWKPDKFGDPKQIAEAGYTLWGASALRSSPDNSYITSWEKHLGNLSTFIPYARENGYKGMINTSWSTSGQYGYIHDAAWEVMDMQPIRQVYPLKGFDMLQRAFSKAVNSKETFDAEAFVRSYALDHFGFGEKGQQVLLDYLYLPQNTVSAMRYSLEKISDERQKCEAVRTRMADLKPRTGKDDFAHLCLMLDIRINYLKFKEVEMKYESESFTSVLKEGLAKEIEPLLKDAEKLKKQYIRLNRGFLKNPAESLGKHDYMEKMQHLYETLSK